MTSAPTFLPSLVSTINRAHPLGSRIIIQYLGGTAGDSATGRTIVYNKIGNETNTYKGRAVSAATFDGSTSYIDFGSPNTINFGNDLYSVEILVWLPSVASQQALFDKDDESSNRQFFTTIQGAGALRFGFSNNSGGYTLFDASSPFPTGRWVHVLGCRTGSNTVALFFDGAAVGGSYGLQTATSVGATTANLRIGARANGNLPMASGSKVALARFYKGDISAWAQKLSDNPWLPLLNKFSFNLSGFSTSSGVSGTFFATEQADTFALSGTTTVLGTVAISEQPDTFAILGTSTIVGTISISAGDDTFSLSGSVGNDVSGSVAIVEQPDSGSAAGTTTVVGFIAIQNQNDTTAIPGTTTVLGTIAISAIGDSFAIFGSSGTSSYTFPPCAIYVGGNIAIGTNGQPIVIVFV